MAEQTLDGVTASAPVAEQPAPVVEQPPVAPAQPASGFNAPPLPNGFAPQPQPQVAPAQPVEPIATTNDRTAEQFSKLTEANQRMSTQNDTLAQTNELLRQELLNLQKTRQQSEQQFAPVQQVPPAQGQQQSVLPKLSDYVEVDAQGNRFVNEAKFNAAVAEIYQTASRAEEVVKNYVQTAEQREIERQERETFTQYPQLNPKSGNFDQRFSQQTRAIIYDSMINPHEYGGRPLSFKAAADYVTQGQPAQQAPQVTAVPTPAVNEANQVQKEQAAATAQQVPPQVTQNIDQDREYNRLVQGTRLGSDEAIAVRLLNASHKVDDVERQGI